MSRYITSAVCFFLMVALGVAGSCKTPAWETEISAESAILIDRESRRVLWEKDAHRTRPMASVTKIMTALLALELGEQSEEVVVSSKASGTEGSSLWLEQGERKTLEELLYGLMLCSGNDAAVAIAEHLAGTEENFALLMTCKARQLGARNTHFINPHGLPDDQHYSNAYDLALISCQALDNRAFRNIVSTDHRVITWPGNPEGRFLNNQNRLLELYSGADGIKTGWTRKAGRCLAGSATKNNWQLVAVVLDAPQMWEDVMMLLDYGYRTYTRKKIFSTGQILARVPVVDGKPEYIPVVVNKDLHLPLLPGEEERLQYKWKLAGSYCSPLGCGEKLGELEIYLDDYFLGRLELNAGQEVKRLSAWERFIRQVHLLL